MSSANKQKSITNTNNPLIESIEFSKHIHLTHRTKHVRSDTLTRPRTRQVEQNKRLVE